MGGLYEGEAHVLGMFRRDPQALLCPGPGPLGSAWLAVPKSAE